MGVLPRPDRPDRRRGHQAQAGAGCTPSGGPAEHPAVRAVTCSGSVCPHCRRDSDAWRYWEGRWWSPATAAPPLWFDEPSGSWRGVSELPMPDADTFDVVVREVSDPKNTVRIARIVADTTGEQVADVVGGLGRTPATVLTGATYATAEGIRSEIARKGAVADLRPHDVHAPTPPPDTV